MKMRQILLFHGENGFWVVEVPSLPGCVTQGATKEEAIRNAREAISLHIESLVANGRSVPDDPFDAMLIAV